MCSVTFQFSNFVNLSLKVELAHWFYIDFHRVQDPSLPEMKLPQFTARIFAAYPFLLKGDDNASQLITKWRDYKRSVPTYGAIICNKKLTHCILVQGSSEKSTWGFPKGKVRSMKLKKMTKSRSMLMKNRSIVLRVKFKKKLAMI